jgi:hypothetical protein
MLDVKTTFRTTLTSNVALTTLVPATRIFVAWPSDFNTLPCIAYREIDNFLADEDYSDDTERSEQSTMQVDIFCGPNTSSTAIARAIDTALSGDKWNRDYSEDFIEPDTVYVHRVMRYSKRIFV